MPRKKTKSVTKRGKKMRPKVNKKTEVPGKSAKKERVKKQGQVLVQWTWNWTVRKSCQPKEKMEGEPTK